MKQSNKDFLTAKQYIGQDSKESILAYLEQYFKKQKNTSQKLSDVLDLFTQLLVIPNRNTESYKKLRNNMNAYALHLHTAVTSIEDREKLFLGQSIRKLIFENCMDPNNMKHCNITVLSPINQIMVTLAHQLISVVQEISMLNNQTYIFLSTLFAEDLSNRCQAWVR